MTIFSRNRFLGFVVLSILSLFHTELGAAPVDAYHCTLSMRSNVMESFESIEGRFDGNRPMEIELRNLRLRFQDTGVGDNRQLSMWLGHGREISSVTTAEIGQKSVYMNLLIGELFVVARCERS